MMVHPLSHKTPNEINGNIFIFWGIWVYLAFLLRPGIWSVLMCEESIVLPSGSLVIISFDVITGFHVSGGLF